MIDKTVMEVMIDKTVMEIDTNVLFYNISRLSYDI